MISGREDLRNLLISTIVVSGAFTFQNITFSFFALCFSIVLLSYLAHAFVHKALQKREGLRTSTELSPAGVVVTVIFGAITQGLVVVAVPFLKKLGSVDTERWMKKSQRTSENEVGLVSSSGPLVHLVLGTLFMGLYVFANIESFHLASLINFWLGLSNLIPYQPIDGGNVAVWSGWLWFIAFLTGSIGILGLLVFL